MSRQGNPAELVRDLLASLATDASSSTFTGAPWLPGARAPGLFSTGEYRPLRALGNTSRASSRFSGRWVPARRSWPCPA